MSHETPGMITGAEAGMGCLAMTFLVAVNLVFWLGGIWIGFKILQHLGAF